MLIIIDGAIAYRAVGPSGKLAKELSHRFTVYRYHRRGRGQRGDASTYSIHLEIDDIQALIEQAGAPASLLGLSSGAVLALQAANRWQHTSHCQHWRAEGPERKRSAETDHFQPLLRMRMRGLEPPRTCIHTDLNRARLPIPPHPRGRSV